MHKFHQLTELYSTIKTVRNELIPEPETKCTFDELWAKSLTSEATGIIAKDKKIAEARENTKLILNELHEQFIQYALTSTQAQSINFTTYLESFRYKKKENVEVIEKELRQQIGEVFFQSIQPFLDLHQKDIVEKNRVKAKVTTRNNEDKVILACSALGTEKIREVLFSQPKFLPNGMSIEEYQNALTDIKGSWGCLDTFILNRSNYYACKEERNTAIATRIVCDILPTFCANLLQLEENIETYRDLLFRLKNAGIETQILSPKDGSIIQIENINFEIFDISQFHKVMLQTGIEAYNLEVAKLSEIVNLANQQFASAPSYTRLKTLSRLHKQIGCQASQNNIRVQLEAECECDLQPIMSDMQEQPIRSVEALVRMVVEQIDLCTKGLLSVHEFSCWLSSCEKMEGVYMTDKAVDAILYRYMSDPYNIKYSARNLKTCATFNKKAEESEQVKWRKAVELEPLFRCIDETQYDNTAFKDWVYKEKDVVVKCPLSVSQKLIALICSDLEENMNFVQEKSATILALTSYSDEASMKMLKEWFDSVLSVFRIIRYFNVQAGKVKGVALSTEQMQYVDYLLTPDWFEWYDMVRNYLTRKPQDDVKKNHLKLNFDNPSLFLKGWSEGEETVKNGVLLRRDGVYYLCILTKKSTSVFVESVDNPMYSLEGEVAERMVTKDLKFRTLTGKWYRPKHGKNYNEETDDQLAIANVKDKIRETYLEKYPKLVSILDREFSNKAEFRDAVESILEKYIHCQMTSINWDYLKKLEAAGELFLFRIHNKDFAAGSSGRKNLHTLYWESIFLPDSPHCIAGNAEIFAQEPVGTHDQTTVHEVGSFLVNRRDTQGDIIPQHIYKELNRYGKNRKTGELNPAAQEYIDKGLVSFKEVMSGYEFIKDRRFYSGRRYFLHCPIKINFKSKDAKPADNSIEHKINETLCHEDTRIIGIDRGEKHLVYYCLLRADGSIEHCGDFDTINGTNYIKLLEERSKTRQQEAQDWRQKTNISNLKKGYLSLVVNRIVDECVIKSIESDAAPAYIVLEKLSREMKGKRAHIEKQTYEKLEVALANKLALVVDKGKSDGLGSVRSPLQLVPEIKSYSEHIEGRDSVGIMQYTRANYTSITDPLTGWRQSIYIPTGKADEVRDSILDRFNDIRFDGQDYAFDYTDANTGREWTLYSGTYGKPLDRYYGYDKIKHIHTKVNVVEILDQLFADFDKTRSLKQQLLSGTGLRKVKDSTRTPEDELRFVIKMIQQIRNTGNESKDEDYLLSPVRDEKGRHFDSRNHDEFEGLEQIKNGDANGAYNIARKGLIMKAHRLFYNEQNKGGKLNLFVSDEEWDLWLQDQEKWYASLSRFACKKEKND